MTFVGCQGGVRTCPVAFNVSTPLCAGLQLVPSGAGHAPHGGQHKLQFCGQLACRIRTGTRELCLALPLRAHAWCRAAPPAPAPLPRQHPPLLQRQPLAPHSDLVQHQLQLQFPELIPPDHRIVSQRLGQMLASKAHLCLPRLEQLRAPTLCPARDQPV